MLLLKYQNLEQKTNKQNKTEIDTQIKRAKQWSPVGKGKGERQDKGMTLRGTICYQKKKKSYKVMLYSIGNTTNIL